MNLKKNIKKVLKEETNKFELVKNFIYTMYDNVIFLKYDEHGIYGNTKLNEIMVYYDKTNPVETEEICKAINDYTGLNVVPWYEYDKNRTEKEPDFYLDTERYEEELNENYSPAGKEITPNKIVIHKSNPKFRDRISNEGLKAIAGECYKIYAGYGEKCIPAIFATNSTNKRAWFDSTYDDDVWTINTELIPNVKWYKDRHFESYKKHIVTFDNIPSEAIELMREGTGRDLIGESSENKDMTNDIEKNLKAIRLLLKQVNWEGLCDIWVEYDYLDKEYAIKSKYVKKDLRTNNDIQKELVFLGNVIRSMGIMVYIYGPWYVEDCEDEVKFMDENINESKEESKKEMIENVLNNIILPEYDHVICGFEVKLPNERNTLGNNTFKFVSVTVTFIGGHGTKLFPQTQGIKQMYDNIMDEIWRAIYNYTNEAVDTYYKTVNDCGKKNIYLKESIRKVLKEDRQPSNFLRRRLDMLDYEVERGLNAPFGGANICIFFKSEEDFFESVMENAIDAMYYNHFSHIDDGSGEWANEYLDMVDYIRNKYKDKIMKHYDDNCGSGSIPLKESIRKLLREETDGVNTLIDDITSRHEMSDELIEKVKDFISQSNCKKIEFANFKMPAMGVALHDGVLINKIALNQRLEYLLFIIFHETAHQYQFKKYGEDLMYECYLGDISVEEAANLMKHTEEVADEFAGKKIKQLQKQGLLDKGFIPPSLYKNAPMSQIIAMVGFYRLQLKQQNITTPDKISEFFYNMVKNNI